MKILHTSDWHLGHRLYEQSQYEEQLAFLAWLKQCIIKEHIDVLLLSGDVYDTGVPSTQSQKLYYDFLVGLQSTSCQHIIVTGGNHDAPGTINAPKALLEALSIQVVGRATKEPKDEVFTLEVNQEKVIIAAVPYLRDQDIRRAVAGESFEQIEDRYKTALTNHYNAVGEYCKRIKTEDTPVIAMGHLFAIGGSVSDSEQNIYVGNLGHIGSEDFHPIFNYIALGHLHKPQRVGQQEHIRYSGSPNVLSFSELGYKKQVVVIETASDQVTSIQPLEVPLFRDIIRLKGHITQCIEDIRTIKSTTELTPWIEIVLEETFISRPQLDEIHQVAKEQGVDVLKVTLKQEGRTKGLEQLLSESKKIKELSPIDVFKLKCEEQDFNLEEHQDILDAFNEALQIVKKG